MILKWNNRIISKISTNCCVGKCRSVYSETDEMVTVNNNECHKWIWILPNIIYVTKYVGACQKHWPTGDKKIRSRGNDKPRNPPSIFEGISKLYLLQTFMSPSHNVWKRLIACGSCSSASEEQKVDKNVIKTATISNSCMKIFTLM